MKRFQELLTGKEHSAECNNLIRNNPPIKIDTGGVFICIGGKASIAIDLKQFDIVSGDMVVIFPYTIVQLIGHSEDFDGKLLTAEVSFFNSLQIKNKSLHYLNIKDNPCISLKDCEANKIRSLHDMLINEGQDKDHPLREEIDECLMKVIAYEVAAIYLKRSPLKEKSFSRNEMIFQKFIFSLFNSFQSDRSIEFYAQEQSITARHLSSVIKQVSNSTASEWIINCTISHIKSRLKDHSLSIKDISHELNFSNPSFFTQYFKRYTGITPKEYRLMK